MQEKVHHTTKRSVRKQVQLTPDQSRRLKAAATAAARSEGELMREAIDDWLARQTPQDEADWQAAWRQAAGMWEARDDLDDLFPRLRDSWDRAPARRRRDPQRRS